MANELQMTANLARTHTHTHPHSHAGTPAAGGTWNSHSLRLGTPPNYVA